MLAGRGAAQGMRRPPPAAPGCTSGSSSSPNSRMAPSAAPSSCLAVAHRHVDQAALQIDRLVAGGNAHIDVGMQRGEAAQARDQPQRGEAAGGRHGQVRRAAVGRAAGRSPPAAAPATRSPPAAARGPARSAPGCAADARTGRRPGDLPAPRICRLTADCVMNSSSAALVKDRLRAAASKPWIRSSGGRLKRFLCITQDSCIE